ncbi:MAG: FecR domain-containing protein [Bacteroidetes bacterium]|nr:FecR domain-containing protein [Bacteroidota bacterium]
MINLLSRLLRRNRQQSVPEDPSGGDGLPPGVSSLLDQQRQWLHAQKADTRRQWLYLRNVLQPGGVPVPRKPLPGFSKVLRPALVAGILASAAGMIAILVVTSPTEALTYETGRGQLSTVMLADSSRVTLNHTSALTVTQYQPREPRIVHLKGEAFFQVQKNGSSFTVETASGSIEVLGTEFNVRERRGRLEVAVVSGKVQVRVMNNGTLSTTVLPAGTLVAFAPDRMNATPEPILFQDYPGWLHGRLTFQKTPLADVCEELQSRFDIQVRIAQPAIAQENISGVLDSRNAESAVQTLAQLTSLRVRHDAASFILY